MNDSGTLRDPQNDIFLYFVVEAVPAILKRWAIDKVL